MSSPSSRQSLDDVFSLAYEELRRLARSVLRNDAAAGITPTTLVNEAWIKLAGSPEVADTTALHFRRIAGRAMRQVLVDAARRRQALSNGGGHVHVTFDESLGFAPSVHGNALSGPDLLALDRAICALHALSPRQAELVEARFFGGYSCEECATLLGISEATVMRDWRAARAWLASQIKDAAAEHASAAPAAQRNGAW